MKKFLALAVGALMCIPLALGVSACGKKTTPVSVSSKEVYAMSALSSVMYFEQTQGGAAQVSALAIAASSRPATITQEDVDGVKSCLAMFKDILQNNGISQTTEKNTEQGSDLDAFHFVMTISLPNLNGSHEYKLYYNETETTTNREIEDEEEEVEVSTKLEGVLVTDENRFTVNGVKEVEIEGKEVETSIKWTTHFDSNNFVVVEQEVEDNEIEYEYKIFKNGIKTQDIEIELEKKKGKTELEFELVDLSTGVRKKTAYKLKTADESTFEVTLKRDGTTQKFAAKVTGDETTFTYANGFSETV